MTRTLAMECACHFTRHGHGARKELKVVQETVQPPCEPGRVPRVARLMALALRLDELLRNGELHNFKEIALLGRVSRARISQIMSLLNLAPDIQEAILFLPRTIRGRDPIILQEVRPITGIEDWRKQR